MYLRSKDYRAWHNTFWAMYPGGRRYLCNDTYPFSVWTNDGIDRDDKLVFDNLEEAIAYAVYLRIEGRATPKIKKWNRDEICWELLKINDKT